MTRQAANLSRKTIKADCFHYRILVGCFWMIFQANTLVNEQRLLIYVESEIFGCGQNSTWKCLGNFLSSLTTAKHGYLCYVQLTYVYTSAFQSTTIHVAASSVMTINMLGNRRSHRWESLKLTLSFTLLAIITVPLDTQQTKVIFVYSKH
ncbi:CLUMA_CG016826, isoform A [Clunio marinus]|uniref:CLUMA_CG016826, isoform A n=1 Tax=Clunio marinus TaxID=568069 RepID=A0A1J1IT47_9DIPT|nr:CLUMA_CG016826, isoform A [Clunio marinus]